MSSRNQLGRFLRGERLRHDWTQKEVATKLQLRGLHVASRTLSKHETGQQIPDGDTLRHYAELYELDYRDLVALAAASTYEVADPENVDHLRQQLTGRRQALADRSTEEPRDPIDGLEETHNAPPQPLPLRSVYLLGAVLVLLVLLVRFGLGVLQASSPTHARVVDGQLVAFADERPLWSVPFTNLGDHLLEPLVRDVDLDGRSEVVFSVQQPEPRSATEHLHCYTPNGELRWKIALGRPQTIRGRAFTPYYLTHFLRWIETRQTTYLLVVARHHLWYPTQVLLLDPKTGETISEYWHPGYFNAILTFDVHNDGTPELLMGGTNNPDHGPGHPIIAVLDLPFKAPSNHPNLFGPQNSREHSYIVLPRPDSMDVHTELLGVKSLQRHRQNRFSANVRSSDDNLLYYEFDADLNVTDLRPTDAMIRIHNRFATAGHLDHRYSRHELDSWKRVLRFPTAPDANDPAIRAAFAAGRADERVAETRVDDSPQHRPVSR